jgi:Flp pilus assembly protein TadG
MRGAIGKLEREVGGAVAPTVALSLFALIAASGIAFDYARLATMDTELQNAADQAALAAASQLDGEDGACARAAAAAANMVSHSTLFANDSNGTAIVVQNESACDATGKIRFWKDVNKTIPADDNATAKFVEVEVDPRTAFYALTPVVGAFSSGLINAVAFAGLDSAICKVPPLMLCNPDEAGDPQFTIANYVGKGIRLVANDGGGNYGPGNFGFLEAGLDTTGSSGAAVLRRILGRTSLAADCVAGDAVTTDPGNMVSVRDALNVRFDIYDQGLNQACGANGGLCPPSLNTRKDLLQKGNGNNCGLVNNATGNPNGWKEADNPYPGSANPPGCDQNTPNNCFGSTPSAPVGAHLLSTAELSGLSPTGYPRDVCHAFSVTGTCSGGRIGTGTWDRFAYFRSHPTEYSGLSTATPAQVDTFMTNTFGTTTPTRYQVYNWEMQAANRATRLRTGLVIPPSSLKASSQPVCAPAGSGVFPSETQVDRRVLSVAVVNCTVEGVKGKTPDVNVTKWIDIFLTEPSLARGVSPGRTENSDVYVEVVGLTQNATEAGAVQLVKKSVPYLIE